jgi:metal-responsive CopG/Arc/MetJ family transcriptional regulator
MAPGPRFFRKADSIADPVHRLQVDFTRSMLDELDALADELNVSRQALIKKLVRQALDQHYLAAARRKDLAMTPLQ